MFVNHRISAVPVVDAEGKVVNIYAKFDVIVSMSLSVLQNFCFTCLATGKKKFYLPNFLVLMCIIAINGNKTKVFPGLEINFFHHKQNFAS